ncbi:SLC13 family permease [Desulfopila sp. IMCC35006]|uniref:SLC13 family permease n=1 Tax=Desulfopila sp. IMCC35006 TaxID=2569542 RepID=UPI0010ACCB53|nr:SLC13 family permease [Desulfopila sp. IMCC35006]TKB25588.1 SLC13 family permease [Desulfopila sp. IMCC35006]
MSLPLPPNPHTVFVLLLTLFALFLFSREKIPLESSSLFILVALSVGFEVFPYHADDKTVLHAIDFFSGFGNEALVAVCALMIAGQGILRTGGLEPVGRILAKLWKINPSLSLLLTLLLGAFISAFINNVPVVVLLLPVLISVSLKTQSPASAVLMPMGFSTLVGGTCTSIGTSTNLLVVSVAAEMGLEKFGMFDFLVPAVIAGSVGIMYLWLVAPRLIAKRDLAITDSSPRIFAAHLAVLKDSPIVGVPLSKAVALTDGKMKVAAVERGEEKLFTQPGLVLHAGDHLVLLDTPVHLKEYEKILKGTLYPADAEDVPIDEDHPLEARDQQLAEVVIIEGSQLNGSTLSNHRFAERYGLITLALHRTGRQLQQLQEEISDIRLMVGDILLVQGPREQISELKKRSEVLVLDATVDLPFSKKAPLAMFIMKGIILTAAFGLLPIAISATLGALLMIITGCLSWRDATRALSAQVVLIVVASLALGMAMLETGGAEYLGSIFVALAGNASPALVISGLMLMMAVLTNIISNNATAVIGTPVAISIASQMGQPPEPFVLAVLFGANMSYATPMAYKTNLLVMSAGEYTFAEFLKVGIPLVFIMWAMFSFLLPWLYL